MKKKEKSEGKNKTNQVKTNQINSNQFMTNQDKIR